MHAIATKPTHVHALVSWSDDAIDLAKVRGRLKNLLSLALFRRAGTTGRPWFSTGCSRKRIRDAGHLEYSVTKYLRRHAGVGWYETRGWVNVSPGLAIDDDA